MDKKIERLLNIRDNLCKVILYSEQLKKLNPRISWLHDTIKELKREEIKFSKRIDNLIKKCTHDWKYDGHGHNDDAYKCTICGEMEYR